MGQVAMIGLNIARSVSQVLGVGAEGEVIIRRQIRRAQSLQFFSKQLPWKALDQE
jgi:transposase